MTKRTVGIDISKAHLDVFRLPEGEAKRFANETKAVKALVGWMDPEVERIAYEPSGPWHRDLQEALAKAGFPLYPVNPKRVRRFAEAAGLQAKTDAIDARVLAVMARSIEDLRPLWKRSNTERDLVELQASRDALARDRTAVKNRGKHVRLALLKRHHKARLKQIERHLKALDKEILNVMQGDPELARRVEILTSIPGISYVTAAKLICHMPELGSLTAKQVASLAGLAPVTRESGAWRGSRWIRGGRHQVRVALYMPTMVATKYNPDLRRQYEQLIARGKATNVARIAIMRKLIILANLLIQQNRCWELRDHRQAA